MNYVGNIIRPPSEAHSIILQVTVGCSHNKCTFCGAYKNIRFRIKDTATIQADLEFASRYCRNQSRVFLADGDVLIVPADRLAEIFFTIRQKLPWIRRISLYANAKSILRKTAAELENLQQLGLDRIYLGLESGHDPTLMKINKGVTSEQMILAAKKARQAKIFLSVTVQLGIAGKAHSADHAKESGRVLTAMKPNQIAVLTLMLLENTPLYHEFVSGSFHLPDQAMLLEEMRLLVEAIGLERVQFQANHASNYLPISGRLAKDRQHILQLIESGLSNASRLKSEHQRFL